MDHRAVYIRCDAGMDYKPKNPGGLGVVIEYPDFVDLETVEFDFGKCTGANIERLELEAIIRGMDECIKIFADESEKLKSVKRIIVVTDRFGLKDEEKTSPYRIRDWRKNKWKNFEGKSIKNQDLLDKLDKMRKKLAATTYCTVDIEYKPRKFNKEANRLSQLGKKKLQIDDSIEIKGTKQGKRKYDGDEIKYSLLKEKEEYIIHIFKKDPVSDQWEIHAEFCEGIYVGKKLKIYTDDKLERKLPRNNYYRVRVKKVFRHHITIYKTLKKLNIKKDNLG